MASLSEDVPRFREEIFVVVASTNDLTSRSNARAMASAWGADFVNAAAVGHINVEAGFGPWTEGVRMVNSLIALADACSPKSWNGLGLAVRPR
jgi:uncharacterized protein